MKQCYIVHMKIMLVNGPNLQLLGSREPGVYGLETLQSIVERLNEVAAGLGCDLTAFQSNSEGAIVDFIGKARLEGFDGIIINPAAYTHTSVAIRDAIAAVALPAVEVHLSNIMAREDFRHRSLTAPVCIGMMAGFGGDVYEWALRALAAHCNKLSKTTKG